MYTSHKISTHAVETYYLGYTCSETFSEYIKIELSGTPSGTGVLISCDNIDIYLTNSLNYWYMPLTVEKITGSSTTHCDIDTNKITVYARDLPAGYHIFINVRQSRQFPSLEHIENYFKDSINCKNNLEQHQAFQRGSFVKGSGDAVASIKIELPSTKTTSWTGTAATTFLTTETSQSISVRIIIATPIKESTTYAKWTGSYTSTYDTLFTTRTGSDGIPTVSTLYYVQTPMFGYYTNSAEKRNSISMSSPMGLSSMLRIRKYSSNLKLLRHFHQFTMIGLTVL